MNEKHKIIYELITELFDIYKANKQKDIGEVSNLGFTIDSIKIDKDIDFSLCYVETVSVLLKEKLYSEIIDYHNNHINEISENINDDYMLRYNVILGLCYQELGKLGIADGYYDHFLNNISVDKKDIPENLDEYKFKLLFLMREISELGFTYKVDKKKYDNYKKNKKVNHNEILEMSQENIAIQQSLIINGMLKILGYIVVGIGIFVLLYQFNLMILMATFFILFVAKVIYVSLHSLGISLPLITMLKFVKPKNSIGIYLIVLFEGILSSTLLLFFIYIFIEYYIKVTIHTSPIYLSLLGYGFFLGLLYQIEQSNNEKFMHYLLIYASIIFYSINIFLLNDVFDIQNYLYAFIGFLFCILITIQSTKNINQKAILEINNKK